MISAEQRGLNDSSILTRGCKCTGSPFVGSPSRRLTLGGGILSGVGWNFRKVALDAAEDG
jgi:hypothetical protein